MSDYQKESQVLAKKLVNKLIDEDQTIVFGESMTGGLLASLVTGVEDASKVLKESFVVYADLAKIKFLHCKPSTIEEHSVYSDEIIEEMIHGLSIESNAHIRVAVSGIAGPKSFQDLTVGTVFIGIQREGVLNLYQEHFKGDRDDIRYQTAIFIFKNLLK
jgi:nicotinamide-nucleotide amidase